MDIDKPAILSRSLKRPRFLERFWSKVQKADGCWLWMAAKNEHGYGRLR